MKYLLTTVAILTMGGHALAYDCYARTYSADHMGKNPNQSVREMTLSFSAQGDERYAQVRVQFRGSTKDYYQGLICWDPKPDRDGNAFIGCSVECDGGSFLARRSGDDAVLLETRGFAAAGDCGEGDIRYVRDEGVEKTVFKLFKTADLNCVYD